MPAANQPEASGGRHYARELVKPPRLHERLEHRMRREELAELHYITPIANVRSILRRGILSHQQVARLPHESVAMPEVQERRALRALPGPGKRMLHQFANLYFHARNPMMWARRFSHMNLCVLRVSTDVLDLPGVVIADRNAAGTGVNFDPVASALASIDYELVFAESWTHPEDQGRERRHKSIKCAEVLVPDRVAPDYVFGAYVSGTTSRARLAKVAPSLEATVNADLFFNEETPPIDELPF